jgi:transcription antitermination factor NusG
MNWTVLHLRPRSEKKVAGVCLLNGIEHYLPLREETKIYQRRKVTVYKPLFSGYLFAAFNSEQRVILMRTQHLLRILPPDDEAGLLRDLDQIRMALEADPRLEADSAYREGRRVRIKSGPFEGIEGGLTMVRGRTQVRLSVEMIGQSVSLNVDRDLVEFVD